MFDALILALSPSAPTSPRASLQARGFFVRRGGTFERRSQRPQVSAAPLGVEPIGQRHRPDASVGIAGRVAFGERAHGLGRVAP